VTENYGKVNVAYLASGPPEVHNVNISKRIHLQRSMHFKPTEGK